MEGGKRKEKGERGKKQKNLNNHQYHDQHTITEQKRGNKNMHSHFSIMIITRTIYH